MAQSVTSRMTRSPETAATAWVGWKPPCSSRRRVSGAASARRRGRVSMGRTPIRINRAVYGKSTGNTAERTPASRNSLAPCRAR